MAAEELANEPMLADFVAVLRRVHSAGTVRTLYDVASAFDIAGTCSGQRMPTRSRVTGPATYDGNVSTTSSRLQMSSHRFPIHLVPARVQIVVGFLRKAHLIESHCGAIQVGSQFESDNGEDAPIPTSHTPRLDDEFGGDNFKVSPLYLVPEERENVTTMATDHGGRA